MIGADKIISEAIQVDPMPRWLVTLPAVEVQAQKQAQVGAAAGLSGRLGRYDVWLSPVDSLLSDPR